MNQGWGGVGLAMGLGLGLSAPAVAWGNDSGEFGARVMMTSQSFEVAHPGAQRLTGTIGTIFQGDRLQLNGRTVNVPWVQWIHNGRSHIGISDGNLVREFGLDLLDTEDPDVQPVHWFSDATLPLPVLYFQNTRYLGINAIAQSANWTINPQGKTLAITWEPAQIVDFRSLVLGDRRRYVLELDRPVPFQVSPVPGELTLSIDADLNLPEPLPAPDSSKANSQENSQELNSEPATPFLPITAELSAPLVQTPGRTVIRFPTSSRLWLPQAFTLLGPTRIVVEARPDLLTQRSLQWSPGVRWRQEFVSLNNEQFPATWVELDPTSPEIELVAIPAQDATRTGIASVWDTAKRNQLAIAINGGYFNRVNKLPLGAMRQDGQWLSGPILNRGAIAWNDAGEFTFGRLVLKETITANGKAWDVLHLNSGYLKAGISRYDRHWDDTYITMTDNEVGIVVETGAEGDRVIQQIPVPSPGGEIPIPDQGYLLVTRSFQTAANALPVGTDLILNQETIPADFNRFPHILAAGPLLVADNEIVLDAASEGFSAAFIRERAARSAIAQRADGTILLVTIHSRKGGRGPTLAEMAQLVQSMGAVNALNLDGGSSTTLYLSGQTIDRPSRTSARVHGVIGVFINP